MPPLRTARTTLAVVAALVACFVAEVAFSSGEWTGLLAPPVRTLVTLGGVVKSLVLARHEWWRLLAGPLLHGDLLHLASNGLAILFAGAWLERRLGPARWLTLYGLGATLGAVGSTLANPESTVSVGASGAGMALLAAVFVLTWGEADLQRRRTLRSLSLALVVASLIPQATHGDTMDLAAHLLGAGVGAGLGLAFLREPAGRPFTWPARGVAGAFGLLVAVGLALTAREVPGQLVESGQRRAGQLEAALRRTCGLGSTHACVALGGALASGEELPRDVPAARALVQPLCERDGEPEACFYLGLTFHRASPPRYPEAAAAYEKACARQELSACLNLALILPRSGATGAVATRVRALLEQACPALPRACSELALRLSEGQPADVTRALELARQACEAKEGLACFVAGKLVGAGRGAPRDDDLARIFLEHACHLGEYRGCTAAGLLWRDGVGMPADPARAVGFFEKGCASGEPEACFPLALCLRDGLGVTKDAARARGLLEAGCRAGYRPACGELP